VSGTVRGMLRWVLAGGMVFAGIAHFVATDSFFGQLPAWVPARVTVIRVSGAVEIALGLALAFAPQARLPAVGWVLAALFVLVFPANVYQAVAGTSAFGLDSDAARWGRLLFQPVLIVWALWASGAWVR
jgi:uncharacterized membrane protein